MRSSQCARASLVVASLALPLHAQGASTRRVTVDSSGAQANAYSDFAVLARGGTCVAFMSAASNLVAGDTNGKTDVFVHDLVTGITTRESVDSNGAECNAWTASTTLGISADGRFVAFGSLSTALVAGDTNGVDDVFLRDRVLGTTIRASVGSGGIQGSAASYSPSVSDDGRYVAFMSMSPQFHVPDTNNAGDVFVHDALLGTTTLVGLNAQGAQATFGTNYPAISGDGRFVAFRSGSPNMVPAGANPNQVFVRDLLLGVTTIESVSTAGVIGNDYSFLPFLSVDGRYLAFASFASNLSGTFQGSGAEGYVRDRVAGTTEVVSIGYDNQDSDGACSATSVSDNGGLVLFSGTATNILPYYNFPSPGNQIWLRDLAAGDNVAIAVDHVAEQPVGAVAIGLSSDGRVALFRAAANNVVPGDTNGATDFFVRLAPLEAPIHFCSAKVNSLGCFPLILAFGHSSATQTSGFEIKAASVRNNKPGLLLYTVAGRAAVPFAGGTLCLAPPLHRNIPGATSGGSAAPTNDCTGAYSVDMNAFAAGLLGGPPLPALSQPGARVQCQWWSRDPGFAPPDAVGLTGGIDYTVGS